MKLPATTSIRIADEVWIATALLQQLHPETDFTVQEIVGRVEEECISGSLRPGVYVHVVQHCVANRPPNPARYRMLVETGKNKRRLYRPGDAYNPGREGSKTVPEREEIPAKYCRLIDWYDSEYVNRGRESASADPLLALRGSGKKLWSDEHADEYVRRLRVGWK